MATSDGRIVCRAIDFMAILEPCHAKPAYRIVELLEFRTFHDENIIPVCAYHTQIILSSIESPIIIERINAG